MKTVQSSHPNRLIMTWAPRTAKDNKFYVTARGEDPAKYNSRWFEGGG